MKHIVKSAFFITVGGALPLLASVVLLIPYTDNLNTGDYGALAIYISFTLLVQILMNYGVDSYLSVHYYDHHEDKSALKNFLARITGGLLMYGLTLTLALTVLGWLLFPVLFQNNAIPFWPYGFMSILTGFFNAWFRMYVNIQVFADRARKYFLFGLFNFVVTIAISVVLVYHYPHTLIGPMWGRLLSGVLIFLLTFFYGLREFGMQLVFKATEALRKYSTPIVIFSLLTWVLGYINNYILNGLSTAEDVGVYDFANKTTIVLEYLAIGISAAISPRVYQVWKREGSNETKPEESRFYHAYSAINVFAIAALICILPYAVKLVISNEQYYAAIPFMSLFCISFTLRPLQAMLLGPVYFHKKTKVLPTQLFITAIIQIILSIILIKPFGVLGAVVGVVFARFIQLPMLYYSIRPFYTLHINKTKLIFIPILHALIVVSLYWFQVSLELSAILQMVCVILLVGVVYRNELKLIPDLFIKRVRKQVEPTGVDNQ